MKDTFKKIAEKREERIKIVESTSSDYAAYGPNCEKHPGERKLRVADSEKEKHGFKKSDMVWYCKLCSGKEAYTNSDGTIAQCSEGAFAVPNNLHKNSESITDKGFDAAKEFAKVMGYEEKGI